MGLGLGAVALEEHRQTRQLVPGALVAGQVHLIDRLRRGQCPTRGDTGAQQQGRAQTGKLTHHSSYFSPWPENSSTLSPAYCTLIKVFSSPQLQLLMPTAPEHSVGAPSKASTSALAIPACNLA